MRFALGVNANETTLEIIKKSVDAERLGIDYVWVADMPVQRYSPIIASSIAANTRRIRIGLGLLSPFLYSPVQIANSLITLVEAYGERFELCVGPGDRNGLRRVGISLPHRTAIGNNLLNAKRKIEKTLQKSKVQGTVWLGAQGPKMLDIAKYFDGVLLNYAHPNLIKWAVNKVGHGRKKGFKLGIYAPSYVYKDLDSSVYNLLRISSAIVALGAPKTVLKDLGLHEKIVEAKTKLDAGLIIESILNDIPTETLDLFSIHKSSTELVMYISEISKMKVEHIVFGYPQNFSERTVRELAQALKNYTPLNPSQSTRNS